MVLHPRPSPQQPTYLHQSAANPVWKWPKEPREEELKQLERQEVKTCTSNLHGECCSRLRRPYRTAEGLDCMEAPGVAFERNQPSVNRGQQT